MKIRFPTIAFLFILATFTLLDSYTQASPALYSTGKLKGVVMDVHESRVFDIDVIIENKHFVATLRTNEEGKFEVEVPAGEYQIIVKGHCFQVFKRKGIKVDSNGVQEIKIVLNSGVC